MAFDLALLKKHPYAVGSAALAIFILLYYYFSRNSSGVSASGGDTSALSADVALQQAQTAAAVQTNAQQAQITQTQAQYAAQDYQTSAAADVSNTQTLAALVASLYGGAQSTEVAQINANAETLQQANSETASQNIYALQEGGLQAQINEQYEENANNNATGTADLVDQLNAQGQIASQVINSATGLATQQQSDFETNVGALENQTTVNFNPSQALQLEQTVLANGNPTVAVTGDNANTAVTASNNAKSASIINSISSLASSIGAGLLA